MDPHTATCFKAYENICNSDIKTIIYSTAEWTKFSPVIANALTGEVDVRDLDALASISKEANVEIPSMIKELFSKEVVQKSVIEKEDIERSILNFL
jgi:threonine synthase